MQDSLHREDDDMYSRLMAISQEALEKTYYESAYHVLYAAMHLAHAQGDEHGLLAVAQAAEAQLKWIDSHAPENRMSSQAAVQRSGVNLYNALIKQTHADILILKQQYRRDKSPNLPWLGDASSSTFPKENH
ncbi:MAG: hypothetical protein SAK29_32780 [Scytonema sp. PMC 1069.18]|nr:hypothetical protein [Scytonema sp. PMC 1069.18]MEC4880725.1 hypothetical protein [Scytonema sp. PMC 1070.18]